IMEGEFGSSSAPVPEYRRLATQQGRSYRILSYLELQARTGQVAAEFSYDEYDQTYAPKFKTLHDALPGLLDNPTEALTQVLAAGDGFIIGDDHKWPEPEDFVLKYMDHLAEQGVDTIYFELPRSDWQDYLDIFNESDSGQLFKSVKELTRQVD